MGKSTAWNYVGGIILIAILAGAGYYILYADEGSHNPMNTVSELSIRVESTHLLLDADFKLYIDDQEIQSWKMGPRDHNVYTYTYVMPKSDGTKEITIKVTSTCKSGPQEDSKVVVVGTNQNYTVTLKA